jgi:hypothetical protein
LCTLLRFYWQCDWHTQARIRNSPAAGSARGHGSSNKDARRQIVLVFAVTSNLLLLSGLVLCGGFSRYPRSGKPLRVLIKRKNDKHTYMFE